MPNVRRIWHFMPQSAQHQGMQNPNIANFFAILLQCNSKGRIALQHNSKTYNIFLLTFSDSFSLSFYALVCFSSHSSLHNDVSLSSHLSLMVGYSGVGRGSDMEVRLGKSDRRGMVAISGYIFWVRKYVTACSWVSNMVCSGKIGLQLGLCKF